MDADHRQSAEMMRSRLENGLRDPSLFSSTFFSVPPAERDGWVNHLFRLEEIPEDAELPRGCAPYLPCSVNALVRVVERAPVLASDTFVDVGSGVGRAATFVHLLTGAGAVGIEIQPRLVAAARDLAARLHISRASAIEGDAASLTGVMNIGSVFLLYCPFSGERLTKLLTGLEQIAHTRTIRVCCIDLPLPACNWLRLQDTSDGEVAIYRSTVTPGDGLSTHTR